MTAGAPWSVKGIDPKAREVAKDLARRSGMTLGELLNRLILEDEELNQAQAQAQTRVQGFRTPPYEDPYATTILTPREVPRETWRDEPRSPVVEPFRPRAPAYSQDDAARVAEALERLTDRIEAAERRSALAVSGVDHSVRGVIARLESAEREQTQTTERLRRVELEANGPRSAEAIKSLEQALGKVAGHLQEGDARMRRTVTDVETVVGRIGDRLETAEARTAQAIETLGASFSVLDGRLAVVEGAGGAADRRLGDLAADLSRRMEAARTEMAQKLRDSAEGRFDRMESRLAEMAAHVTGAEQRSAEALDSMRREVIGMADSLNRRVHASEVRNAEVMEQVGGEVSRIASAMETRVSRADTAQAQALEKLGDEIARITERLAERISNAERRSAQAIDEVGEQVARVAERISLRNEHTTIELGDRIRLSEERTALLLSEARGRIEGLTGGKRYSEPRPPPIIIAAPRPAPAEPEVDADQPVDPTGQTLPAETFVAAPLLSDDDFGVFAPEPPPADPDALGDLPLVESWSEPEPPESEPAEDHGLTTREVIERARAAVRDAQAASYADPAIGKSGIETRPSSRSLFGRPKPRRAAGGAMQTALMFSGAAAALGAGVAAYYLGVAEPTAPATARVMSARIPVDAPPAQGVAVASNAAGPAVAEGAALFTAAKAKIEAKDQAGLAPMQRAAELGFTPAQVYVAKLYENGELGMTRDLAQARHWMEQAAESGDRAAMHNLALYYYQGQGGGEDPTAAATWFRRAAERGLVDSQFNLAQLYEAGSGVPADTAEALKWYSIAGRNGDADARAAAGRLRNQLDLPSQVAVDRAVAAFRPAAVTAIASRATAPAAAGVVTAQRALARLGYYKGAADGSVSPQFDVAVASYQRDQNLNVTGALDADTTQRLSVYAR